MARESGNTQSFSRLLLLLALTLLLVPMANASILSAGDTMPPSPLFPTGTTLASISGVTLTTPTFSVVYSTSVLRDPNNTWCANCLDFVYQFTNNGPDVNQRYTMYNFGDFMIAAGTMPFGVHDPTTVSRSASTGGQVISFNFVGNEIPRGMTTVTLVIETNATLFEPGLVSVQDGTANFGNAFQPAIPEPTSLVLMGGGLIAAGGFLR